MPLLFVLGDVAAALPYIAVGIAVLTFLASQREFARSARIDRVEELEERIKECEEDRERLHTEVKNLRDRELELMRRVLRLENGR